MTGNPLITVFVLNWNRKDDLLDALDSVKKQTYSPIEILVVDNGSTDGSSDAVEEAYPEAKVIRLDKNYGCPGGRNRGIPHASGEYIYFLDNDGLLHEDAIQNAYVRMSEDDELAVVSGRTVYYKTGEDRFLFGHGQEHIGDVFYTAVFSGGASMHRASVFNDVGVYPDDFMYGGEEAHLSMRLLDKGYRIIYDPSVIMYHKISTSARDRRREFIYKCSNELATAWQLFPLVLAVLYTLRSVFVQPLRAAKHKALCLWLREAPRRMRQMLTAMKRRKPIKGSTLALINKLRSSIVTSSEDIHADQTYLRVLLNTIIGKRG